MRLNTNYTIYWNVLIRNTVIWKKHLNAKRHPQYGAYITEKSLISCKLVFGNSVGDFVYLPFNPIARNICYNGHWIKEV